MMSRLPFLRLTLPLALLLSGCSTPPPLPSLPQAAAPADWQTRVPEGVSITAETATDASLSAWWQSWQDPLLNTLLEQVLANNPSLNSSGISYRLALLQAGVASAAYRPKGSLSLGGSEAGNEDGHSSSFSAGLSASWELDLWGTRRAQRDQAAANVKRSLDELHAAQVSLIAEVVQSYVDLRAAQAHQQLAQQAIELRRQSYDLARWQRQAGLSTELEQMQALTLLRQTEATLPPYEKAAHQALQQLQALNGGDLQTVLPALQTLQPLPQVAPAAVQVAAEMLRQRPDVQAREQAIRAQNEAIVLARHARYPSFSLSGSLTSSTAAVADLFDADTLIARLAANVSYLLFDGGVLKQAITSQELQLQQSLLSYRSTLLTAQQEVESALTSLDSAQRQQASYQQALAAAELAAGLAQMQYDSGLLSFAELLDAQTSLLNSRSALLSNHSTVLGSRIQLYRSLGGGWQTLPLPPLAMTTAGDSRE